jgi:hypothetical protein
MHFTGGARLLVLVVLFAHLQNVQCGQSMEAVKECIDLTRLVRKMHTDGVTCMSCDTAIDICMPACPPKLHRLYERCDGIELPEGEFFDPDRTIGGKWYANYARTVISTERCGCNRSSSKASVGLLCLVASFFAALTIWGV